MTSFRLRMNSMQVACLACGALMMAGGCAVGPDFVKPSSPELAHFDQGSVAGQVGPRFVEGAQINANWWQLFGSAQIDALVEQALKNSPSLASAQASLHQSQDQLRAGYGVFLPQITAGADAARERVSGVTEDISTKPTVFDLATAHGTISYALDLFGGQRRAIEELSADAQYQKYQMQAAYLALTANVVNTAIAWSAYDAQMYEIEQMLRLEHEQLAELDAVVHTGVSPYTELLTLKGQLAANEAALAGLRQKREQANHLLARLRGAVPSDDPGSAPRLVVQQLEVPAQLPVSLPSALVEQRPDILAAQEQVHAASADIGVATAAMFPSITISGSYNHAWAGSGNLGGTAGTFWSVGPSIDLPLFQGGRLWFTRRAAVDAYERSQSDYRQTVLNAFEQVADALKAIENDEISLRAQTIARESAHGALVLAHANQRAGLIDGQTLVAADIQLRTANLAYLEAFAQRAQDVVALYVALGGGWWNASTSNASRSTP